MSTNTFHLYTHFLLLYACFFPFFPKGFAWAFFTFIFRFLFQYFSRLSLSFSSASPYPLNIVSAAPRKISGLSAA